MWFPIISLFFFQCRNWIHYLMGNHIRSVMNPVPTLEEEEGNDGEPHTFSNESSSYTGRRRGR
jgi:hypothetical protein